MLFSCSGAVLKSLKTRDHTKKSIAHIIKSKVIVTLVSRKYDRKTMEASLAAAAEADKKRQQNDEQEEDVPSFASASDSGNPFLLNAKKKKRNSRHIRRVSTIFLFFMYLFLIS